LGRGRRKEKSGGAGPRKRQTFPGRGRGKEKKEGRWKGGRKKSDCPALSKREEGGSEDLQKKTPSPWIRGRKKRRESNTSFFPFSDPHERGRVKDKKKKLRGKRKSKTVMDDCQLN